MDAQQLRALHQAAQLILQRTAPVPSRTQLAITPAVLDQIAWNVVLAYVANVSERPPQGIPRQAASGEGSLRDDQVRAAVEHLRQAAVRPKLRPQPAAIERFCAAVRRLLASYGWVPQRADQAADEMARALQASDGR